MTRHTPDASLVEAAVRRWLAETGVGSDLVRDHGLDAAVDAVFELLNAGFLKLTGTTRRITGIIPTDRPQPPAAPLLRPGTAETPIPGDVRARQNPRSRDDDGRSSGTLPAGAAPKAPGTDSAQPTASQISTRPKPRQKVEAGAGAYERPDLAAAQPADREILTSPKSDQGGTADNGDDIAAQPTIGIRTQGRVEQGKTCRGAESETLAPVAAQPTMECASYSNTEKPSRARGGRR